MASASNRVFRIERSRQESASEPMPVCDMVARARHEEIMAALGEIGARMAPARQPSGGDTGRDRHDLEEARKIKAELKQIHDAITSTKQQIATLHRGEVKGVEISRMTDELGAIVEGTEQATENILHAAEQIDSDATVLVGVLKQSANHAAASDIQDQVVKIFEACNFQDLTGQRISKVVTAFSFIEQRVERMMEIWGGLDSFNGIEPETTETRKGDSALLNGPALEDDEDIASQDDIDALFS